MERLILLVEDHEDEYLADLVEAVEKEFPHSVEIRRVPSATFDQAMELIEQARIAGRRRRRDLITQYRAERDRAKQEAGAAADAPEASKPQV